MFLTLRLMEMTKLAMVSTSYNSPTINQVASSSELSLPNKKLEWYTIPKHESMIKGRIRSKKTVKNRNLGGRNSIQIKV